MALGLGIGIGIAPGGGGPSTPPTPPFAGMIIDVDTTIFNSSGSGTNQIRLPFQPNSFNYNGNPTGLNLDIIVDWGDGTSDTYNTNPTVDYEVSHTYASAGVYTIKIDSPSQSIQGWSLHGGSSQVNKYDGRKIVDLKQWGYFDFAGNVLSPSGANVSYQVGYNFTQTDNMIISATDTPIISGNCLRGVFQSYQGPSGSTFEIPNLNNWDVSNVILFEQMFNVSASGSYTSPIGDVSNWDMSSATAIGAMFRSSDFTGDVSNWDTSNVTEMYSVFELTPGNPNLSNWDISNVVGSGLSSLFANCSNFTGGTWLNNWVFNSGLNILDRLFFGTQMNTPLNNWQTGNIRSFYGLFGNSTFNQDISMWDITGTYQNPNTYGVLDMFNGASNFDQDLSAWDMQNTYCIRRFMGTGQSSDPEISPAKYDNMLVAFGARIPYTRAKTSSFCGSQVWEFGISKYNLSNSAAVAGRNALISDMGGIVDGGGI
jgi:surface protein